MAGPRNVTFQPCQSLSATPPPSVHPFTRQHRARVLAGQVLPPPGERPGPRARAAVALQPVLRLARLRDHAAARR
eukprot:328143-Pleurochrysis_carterae.AAC.1